MSRTKMRGPGNGSEKKDKFRAKKLAEKLAAAENTTAGEEPTGKEDKKAKKEKKDKKEKKEKKDKKSNPEAVAESTPETPAVTESAAPTTESETPAAPEDASSPSKKRKRDSTTSEIEIDVTLPEPPSKKALRKIKKHPDLADKLIKPSPVAAGGAGASSTPKTAEKAAEDFPEHSSQARSKWGIWIGNLGFSTTRPQLEEFLTRPPSTVQRIEVTRINLPTDPRTKRNKGFAYIDFANQKALDYALTLTETLFLGRKVLIKNSNDFSGRGSGTAPDGSGGPVKLGPNLASKPPSKILFVGNLDFATTEEDLKSHFAFAGPIQKIRLATFEDTGKCKGFGFVDFEDIDSVKRAMLGLSAEEEETKAGLEGKEEEELAKRQKKRRFLGTRQIKMEYGEDSSVRYKKRFGKDRPEGEKGERAERVEVEEFQPRKKRAPKAEDDWAERAWEEKRQRQDKRDTNPGAVYSNDVRRTGAITESKGTKMKFD